MHSAEKQPLLRVRGLCKHFPVMSRGFFKRKIGIIRAVDQVSFDLHPGQTLGLVGESGSGKTTTARAILRAIQPSSGQVVLNLDDASVDLATVPSNRLKPLCRRMQMIFQDPFSSLNPRMTIKDIVGEPLVIHRLTRGSELDDRVDDMLKRVGLKPEHRTRYPHAFSGGQRQRIGIARALIMRPSLVVADEAVSALDVSVQAQIINLLQDLQEELGLTYLFIAHDLSVVRHLCDRVAVMYAGKIVELGDADEVFNNPRHPYTRALLASVPSPDPDIAMAEVISGEVADPGNLPNGCSFHPRCEMCDLLCQQKSPAPTLSDGSHSVACHKA